MFTINKMSARILASKKLVARHFHFHPLVLREKLIPALFREKALLLRYLRILNSCVSGTLRIAPTPLLRMISPINSENSENPRP